MDYPSLSIVISNYNDGRFIEPALAAVREQAGQLAEIILIDDKSTDDSLAKMEIFAGMTANVTLIRNATRQGVIANYNMALARVSTELVYFASSNDMILPGLFALSREMMARHRQAGVCSAQVQYMSETGSPEEVMRSPQPLRVPGYLPPDAAQRFIWREGEWVIGNTAIYRTAALREAGGFNPKLFGACDGFAAATIVCRHGACFVPQVLALWRRDPAGYANTTLQDIDKSRSVMDTAAEIIAALPRVFPQGYAARWRDRWLFATLSHIATRTPARIGTAMSELMPNTAMVTVMQWAGRWPRLARLILLLRLRLFDLPSILVRRLPLGRR